MRTIGISPKLPAAIVAAVITYLLGQEVLELPAGVVVALQGAGVALGVFLAGPGDVETDAIDLAHELPDAPRRVAT